jgi:hypothetical protein
MGFGVGMGSVWDNLLVYGFPVFGEDAAWDPSHYGALPDPMNWHKRRHALAFL